MFRTAAGIPTAQAAVRCWQKALGHFISGLREHTRGNKAQGSRRNKCHLHGWQKLETAEDRKSSENWAIEDRRRFTRKNQKALRRRRLEIAQTTGLTCTMANNWADALDRLRNARSGEDSELGTVHRELRGSLPELARDMTVATDSVEMDLQIRVLGNLVADDGAYIL